MCLQPLRWSRGQEHTKTVRTKEFKLNYGWDGEKEIGELFDLEKDPHEYKNLFEDEEMGPVREKLLRRLFNWIIETKGVGL